MQIMNFADDVRLKQRANNNDRSRGVKFTPMGAIETPCVIGITAPMFGYREPNQLG
jgi:hypothetical protein